MLECYDNERELLIGWAKFIERLEDYPVPKKKKHILELAGNCMLCEQEIDKFRIYYTIENQFVVIEKVEYDGTVNVLKGFSNHKSGHKKYPNQQRDIKKMKKDFKKKYS